MIRKRTTAAALAASFLLGSFAMVGCGDDDKKEEIFVDENATWYTTERIDISDALYSDGKNYDYVNYTYLGQLNDGFCVWADSNETLPVDFDWENDSFSNYHKYQLLTFNSNGELTGRLPDVNVTSSEYEYIQEVKLVDGMIKATVTQYDDRTYEDRYYYVDVDPNTGAVGSRTEIQTPSASDTDNYNEGSYTINGYTITKFWVSNSAREEYSYILGIVSPDGSEHTVNTRDFFPDDQITNIDTILAYGDDAAIIVASFDTMSLFYKLDLTDMTLSSACPNGTDWLGTIDTYGMCNINGHVYASDENSISEIDFDNQTVTEAFNFNNCNINRSDIQDSKLVDMTDDSVVLTCTIWKTNEFTDSHEKFYVYKLTKSATNPNVGKAIIEVGCINGVSRPVADAIFNYNETSTDSFITVSNRYNPYDLMNGEVFDTNAEWEEAYRNAQAEMSNRLAIDLLNGDAPDIIIDGFGYGQLNNDNYMLDLSDYMPQIGTSDYFTNAFDGARVDGALYQIPLSFDIQGILTESSLVDANQIGFTFDQYHQFVSDVCNGKDPIYESKVNYFCKCINAMSDLFADGDSIDYDCDAFRELAEHVKNNASDLIEDEWSMTTSFEMGESGASIITISGFVAYLEEYTFDENSRDLRILGLPSTDGRGPSMEIINSAGISAQAANPDACWEFIKTLLGENVQDEIATEWAFPVNRVSYERTANSMLNHYNGMITGEINASFSGMASTAHPLQESAVTEFANNCISTAHVMIVDPSITIILAEEIQPYFADQKNLDQVLEILQDRVATVMNERG